MGMEKNLELHAPIIKWALGDLSMGMHKRHKELQPDQGPQRMVTRVALDRRLRAGKRTRTLAIYLVSAENIKLMF